MLTLQQSSPEEKDILLRVETEKARDEWVKMLTKASLDFITTKKKMEREKKEQCKHMLNTLLVVRMYIMCMYLETAFKDTMLQYRTVCYHPAHITYIRRVLLCFVLAESMGCPLPWQDSGVTSAFMMCRDALCMYVRMFV